MISPDLLHSLSELNSEKLLTPAEQKEAVRSLLRSDFSLFVWFFWDSVPGAQPLKWNWHLDVLCQELQEIAERVFAGEKRKHDLLINISPNTSKSTIASTLFHPWTWTRMPRSRHMTTTHTEQLALILADKSREVIRSELYQHYFPEIEIRKRQDAKGLYENTLGGTRETFTVSGKNPTGRHFDFMSVDDPLDPQTALSEAELLNARDFMIATLMGRRLDKEVSTLCLIMQRLRRGDPSDVLMEKAESFPVRKVCLPAELPGDGSIGNLSPPELAKHYIEGVMDPVRLGRAVLDRYRKGLGAYVYAGQYLQNPTPLGGGQFKESYFTHRVKAAPHHARRVRFWDRASVIGGCYTAGVLMAEYDGNYYVEHVVHGQWEPHERNQTILAVAHKDRARYGPKNAPTVLIEAEGGSSGKDAFKSLAKVLVGFPVKEIHVSGAKDARAEGLSAQFAAGNVYIVDNDGQPTWDIAGYMEELCAFRPEPGRRVGRYADQVDASCLVKDTAVMAAVGNQYGWIPIQHVVEGMKVLVRNGQWKDVLWAGQTGLASELVSILDDGGNIVTSTKDHKIWVKEKGWVKAEDVQVGDCLICCGSNAHDGLGDDPPWSVVRATSIRYFQESLEVYDLTVDGEHEFFANGILVHNSGAFNYLSNNRRTGQVFRTYTIGQKKAKFHVLVVADEDLEGLITEHPAILINFVDPPSKTEGLNLPNPPHGLTGLLDTHLVFIADIQPSEHQDDWETPVEPFGQLPEQLILDQQGGKKLWSFILKKRDTAPELFVFQDRGSGDRRALSAALAVVDQMAMPRTILHLPSDEERFSNPDNSKGEKPGNQHLYDMIRSTRGMVIG